MAKVEIYAYEDGPYVISGRLATVGAGGQREKHPGTAVALCRCSHSQRLPFCDGAHKGAGFRAPESRLQLAPNGGES